MKKKYNYKSLIFGLSIIILSIIGSYLSTSYALTENGYTINSNNVEYQDNSSLGVTNVQAAIDGTCTKFSNQLTNLKKEVINEMYPKGSIYITTELTTTSQVAEKLGGTWEVYGSGRTLIGSDGTSYKAGTTGGTTTATTTLKTENLPSHTHSINHTHTTDKTSITNVSVSTASLKGDIIMHNTRVSTNIDTVNGIFSAGYTNSNQYATPPASTIGASSIGIIKLDASHTHTVSGTVPALSTNSISTTTSGSTGSGKSFTTSTMQPYIVVYMYRRTA